MIKDIFLIDDDGLVNFLNQEIIRESFPDKNVQAFERATDALDELKKLAESPNSNLPLLILLDINMPVMDGWEFLEAFDRLPTTICKNCKVVMHTSSIDPRDLEKAKTFSSVTDYISKPLTNQSLSKIFLS
ncbi:MAG: response regulator [Bacteroidetes bacterium]|nr:response regulator [Bacteroidota bacterium]